MGYGISTHRNNFISLLTSGMYDGTEFPLGVVYARQICCTYSQGKADLELCCTQGHHYPHENYEDTGEANRSEYKSVKLFSCFSFLTTMISHDLSSLM